MGPGPQGPELQGGPKFSIVDIIDLRFTPTFSTSTIAQSTLGLLPGITVFTRGLNAVPNCGCYIGAYYKLARCILVLQFEVDQALHLARANLARLITCRVDVHDAGADQGFKKSGVQYI